MNDTIKEIRWIVKSADEIVVNKLQETLKIHPVFCHLLAQRGITSFEEAKLFFRPALENLHNPFLMKDMGKAINRINIAIANNEKVLFYGDYDVDGTTSVALIYTFFKNFYQNIGFYIPDRYSEGYGISFQGIDYAVENNFSLIVALDCGIKSIDKIEYANERKVDFVICDHHLPGDEIPKAVAVLDPKRSDCDYPYRELSGCGIGFKLCQAYAIQNNVPLEKVYELLDFVAVSIAADIVPITGENRILAHFGMKKINENPCPGIRSIIELSDMKRALQISDLVFVVGPRINAAGRIKHANQAVELLISEHSELEKITSDKADELNTVNAERQGLDRDITEEALNILKTAPEYESRKSTVLFQPHWHKGVIGIVASRLIDAFYRPTIILTESNGKATGSARSVKGFNIYEAIKSCADLLEQYGGHMYAAGLTMPLENVDSFIHRFEDIVASTIEGHMLTPEIEIDTELNFSDVNDKFFRILKQFAPFGPGNMRPIFLTKNVKDRGGSRVVGENHLKLDLLHRDIAGNGIAFGMAHFAEHVMTKGKPPMPFDICYCVEENEWNGNKTLQMNIKDIKIS
jgi:single-stranded-DNA-specific exonuclease